MLYVFTVDTAEKISMATTARQKMSVGFVCRPGSESNETLRRTPWEENESNKR